MRIETLIKEKLEKEFAPDHLEIVNESHLHKGHAGDDGSGQTHFKVVIVASFFTELSRVERQRAVMVALKEFFDKGLHALRVSASAP